MSDKITSIVHTVLPVSSTSMFKIKELVKYVTFKKGEAICTVGQKNNLEYFVLEGVCKSFLYTPEGEQITISFFMTNSILSPSSTRNQGGKSVINIQALTDVEIATIDASAFEKLMIKDVEIRDFGNTVLRNELMNKIHKEIALASLKGKERLLQLRKKYPNIENRVSHVDIASYLGMTPESFSRIRKKVNH